MQSGGYTVSEFERAYLDALATQGTLHGAASVLLVDDVGTKGSTVSQAVRRLREISQDADIVIATAGQMIVKAAVESEEGFTH